MEFRTQIESPRSLWRNISHDNKIVMLGSCFTDNIGSRLAADGFDVTYNPMGPLYNPVSIANVVERSINYKPYGIDDFTIDADSVYHCLWFASKYQHHDPDSLAANVNDGYKRLSQAIKSADTVIVTLGTAYVYRHLSSDNIVGNCHKFPACDFDRYRLSVDDIFLHLSRIAEALADKPNLIFTVSPVRHTADTLHGNQLSKASLLLGVDRLVDKYPDRCLYFPAYETLIDDLRDYRFYASDMKHPSDVAADYVYEHFSRCFFTAETDRLAHQYHKASLRLAHRPIIDSK